MALKGDQEAASSAYQQAIEWADDIRHAALHHTLCRSGSLHGFAGLVLPVCERALELRPHESDYRDSRGLARALTGGFAGAIEDFGFAVQGWKEDEWCYDEECVQRISERETWIVELEAGRNPLDEETLEVLRNE